MSIVLFDNSLRKRLYPFTLTRAAATLRFGIFSCKERWERLSGQEVYVHTEKYLQGLYPPIPAAEHIWVDAALVVTDSLYHAIVALRTGECLADETGLIAGKLETDAALFSPGETAALFSSVKKIPAVKRLEYPWQLMQWNDEMIRFDYVLATKDRTSQPVPATVNTISPENIFLEEGARLSYCTINASAGPVYIGRNAEIMEGAAIRGPFVLGNDSVVKMNSRIYGATTLGPGCLGGGEIKNTVIMGYSNKAHDGYLGDSVIGEWCNFGAGSSNSNIKNTAGTVKVWSMENEECVAVGQKCGMVMGDYSRASINASINTGSMIGICCNVFGEGLLPVRIQHFSWGVTGNTYTLDKAIRDIGNWKALKHRHLEEEEETMLRYIFAHL
jgi:UDP-N-acetylglucosamine diphosphorylase/glucosamine-1-phosphate N-acetyltransferase